MITFHRRPALSLPITRHFESTRIHKQLVANAYQILIPVISRHSGRPRSRTGDNKTEATIQGLRTKTEGA
jgi:hypothetical protein